MGEFESFFSLEFPADAGTEEPGVVLQPLSMAQVKWWPRSRVATVHLNLGDDGDEEARERPENVVGGSVRYVYELPEGHDDDVTIRLEHRPDKKNTILILNDARERYDLRPGSFVPVDPENIGSLFRRQLRRQLQPSGGRVLFLFSKPI